MENKPIEIIIIKMNNSNDREVRKVYRNIEASLEKEKDLL